MGSLLGQNRGWSTKLIFYAYILCWFKIHVCYKFGQRKFSSLDARAVNQYSIYTCSFLGSEVPKIVWKLLIDLLYDRCTLSLFCEKVKTTQSSSNCRNNNLGIRGL